MPPMEPNEREKLETHVVQFDAEGVKALIDHSKNAAVRRPVFEQLYDPAIRKDGKEPPEGAWPTEEEIIPEKVPYGLILAADAGIWLESNGLPQLTTMVAAAGYDPHKDPGNDFAKVSGGSDHIRFLDGRYLEMALRAKDRDPFELLLAHDGQTIQRVFGIVAHLPGGKYQMVEIPIQFGVF